MYDLLITGGLVVTPSGAEPLDIAIADGRIAALAFAGTTPLDSAARVIDVGGKLVVPGGVDPHVHTNSVLPTAAESGIMCFGADRVSEGAIYGGTTTLVDFAHWKPGDDLSDSFARKAAEWNGQTYTDFALHGTFKEPEVPFSVLEQIPDAVRNGHGSWKVRAAYFPYTDAAPAHPYRLPSSNPPTAPVPATSRLSVSSMDRAWLPVNPTARSVPSSRRRCSTEIPSVLARPMAATTTENDVRASTATSMPRMACCTCSRSLAGRE